MDLVKCIDVRPALADDIERIRMLERQTWSHDVMPYSLDAIPPFDVRFRDAHHQVAQDLATGMVVGFATLMSYTGQRSTGHVGVLQLVCVLPSHRRLDIGRRLVRACIDASDPFGFSKIVAYVLSGNRASLHLLHACGFEEEGRLRGLFRMPSGEQDNVILSWHDEGS